MSINVQLQIYTEEKIHYETGRKRDIGMYIKWVRKSPFGYKKVTDPTVQCYKDVCGYQI